jgi:F0F1-type ATP synthase assembly protein I
MIPPTERQPPDGKKSFNSTMQQLAQYSSLGFQMLFVILIGVFAGKQLDKYFPNEKGWFTIALSLFSVVASLVYVVVKLLRGQK